MWAPGPGPQLLSPAHSHSAVCEYSCSCPHYHRQCCLCFCLRALNPCSGGPRSNLLPENNIMFFHLLWVLHLCVTVARKPLNNSRLLYSSGYYRTKTANGRENDKEQLLHAGHSKHCLICVSICPKMRDSINTTVGALTETRVGEAPGASGPLAGLPSSLAHTLDVEQLHQPALLNQVIPCQLGAHTQTLLPRQDAFHAHSADKSLPSWLPFPFRAQALAPAVYLRTGLIPGCLLPSAVNKIGPLTGQEKTLFGLTGPDGQMPAICFTLQIRLGEIRQLQEKQRRLGGGWEVTSFSLKPPGMEPLLEALDPHQK